MGTQIARITGGTRIPWILKEIRGIRVPWDLKEIRDIRVPWT